MTLTTRVCKLLGIFSTRRDPRSSRRGETHDLLDRERPAISRPWTTRRHHGARTNCLQTARVCGPITMDDLFEHVLRFDPKGEEFERARMTHTCAANPHDSPRSERRRIHWPIDGQMCSPPGPSCPPSHRDWGRRRRALPLSASRDQCSPRGRRAAGRVSAHTRSRSPSGATISGHRAIVHTSSRSAGKRTVLWRGCRTRDTGPPISRGGAKPGVPSRGGRPEAPALQDPSEACPSMTASSRKMRVASGAFRRMREVWLRRKVVAVSDGSDRQGLGAGDRRHDDAV
jgi:hypothetical protein